MAIAVEFNGSGAGGEEARRKVVAAEMKEGDGEQTNRLAQYAHHYTGHGRQNGALVTTVDCLAALFS